MQTEGSNSCCKLYLNGLHFGCPVSSPLQGFFQCQHIGQVSRDVFCFIHNALQGHHALAWPRVKNKQTKLFPAFSQNASHLKPQIWQANSGLHHYVQKPRIYHGSILGVCYWIPSNSKGQKAELDCLKSIKRPQHQKSLKLRKLLCTILSIFLFACLGADK